MLAGVRFKATLDRGGVGGLAVEAAAAADEAAQERTNRESCIMGRNRANNIAARTLDRPLSEVTECRGLRRFAGALGVAAVEAGRDNWKYSDKAEREALVRAGDDNESRVVGDVVVVVVGGMARRRTERRPLSGEARCMLSR